MNMTFPTYLVKSSMLNLNCNNVQILAIKVIEVYIYYYEKCTKILFSNVNEMYR